MLSKASGKSVVYWQTQLPIDYIDTSLVINTWETVSSNLSGGKPARIWYVLLEQTNNGATDEDIELEITINGTAYTFTQTAVSGTQYRLRFSYELTGGDFNPVLSTSAVMFGSAGSGTFSVPFNCSSIGLIRVRQTSAVDVTAAQIEVNIVWDKLVGV